MLYTCSIFIDVTQNSLSIRLDTEINRKNNESNDWCCRWVYFLEFSSDLDITA